MLRFSFLLQSLLLFLPRLEGDKNQAATGWPQRAEWRIGFGMLPQSATSQGAKTNLTSPFHFTVCSRKTQYSTTTVAEPTRHAHRRTSVHHLQSAHWNWQTACVGCLDPPPPPAPWHRGILFISDRKRPLRQSLKTTGLLSKLFAGSHQSLRHSFPSHPAGLTGAGFPHGSRGLWWSTAAQAFCDLSQTAHHWPDRMKKDP